MKYLMCILLVCTACVPWFTSSSNNPPPPAIIHNPPPPIPPSLVGVDNWATTIIVISTLIVGVAIGLFIFEPTLGKTAIMVGGCAGCVDGVTLLLKVSLPYMKYCALGVGILIASGIGYEIYLYVKKGKLIVPKM